ncbi:MAG TPA: DUF4296 domain-containing protein [Cytophagaceae bacterium]|jgi:hypothetical protein|nr:DUF4296 domain-containing protein [Cytophagaceae bacterium]
MKSLSFLLLLFFCLTACIDKKNAGREDIIPKEKMVSILADIHLAEGVVSSSELPKDTSLMLFTALEQQSLAKHGVTVEQFHKSYSWYTSHAKDYKELYAMVVDTLNVRVSIK